MSLEEKLMFPLVNVESYHRDCCQWSTFLCDTTDGDVVAKQNSHGPTLNAECYGRLLQY